MHNTHKRFVTPVLLLIIALLVISGSVYVYTQTKPSVIPAVNPTQQTPTPPQSTPNQTASSTSVLLTIQTIGGDCEFGQCSSKTTLKKDGVFIQENGDKKKDGSVGGSVAQKLQTLIESSNYTTLRRTPFTGECPINYDGFKVVYTFETSHGEEIIDSCQTKIDLSNPLFKAIANIQNTIGSAE